MEILLDLEMFQACIRALQCIAASRALLEHVGTYWNDLEGFATIWNGLGQMILDDRDRLHPHYEEKSCCHLSEEDASQLRVFL